MKEITLRKDYLSDEPVNTIYFGGGTPSLLSREDLNAILQALYRQFEIDAGAEITLEANPDDIVPEAAGEWRRQGINRLSIGVQSFFETDLQWMNRAHSSQQAIDCIRTVKGEGFSNISIDLIYGAPTLSDQHWLENLNTAVSLDIPHLSCYALTVEPGTALDSMTRKKKVTAVSPDDQARQFVLMTDLLGSHGYEHYEISNFAIPGKRSRHNSSYWNGARYLGLGPSAHSFNGDSRQWNISNNASYIQAVNSNTSFFENETLSDKQRFNEYVMVSLRTIEGTDIRFIEKMFGEAFSRTVEEQAEIFLQRGWIMKTGDRLVLTKDGKLFADGIASELFAV